MDYGGNDYGTPQSRAGVSDPRACCQKCKEDTACAAFAWVNGNGYPDNSCYLKFAVGDNHYPVAGCGIISGYRLDRG